MALSNAERQARWRERQKEKLLSAQARLTVEPLRDDPWTRLFEAYEGGAEQWRTMTYRRPGDPLVANALRIFGGEKITQDDVLQILEMTAFARMNDIYGPGTVAVEPRDPEWRTHREEVAKYRSAPETRRLCNAAAD